MQVLLLGPVTVVAGDHAQRLTSARQAALLTVLATFRGAVVSHDRLVEALWGDNPPATARNTLQVHVSALRRLIGTDVIRAEREGYLLHSGTDVDAIRFRDLTAEGRAMLESRRPAEAARLLRAALALWRGDPLTDVDTDWAVSERERLTQLRLLAMTSRLDADVALGRHLQVLDELAALCRDHPFHEDLTARRMIALYRAGRQADALAVFAQTRLNLLDELGVDPGAELQALHKRMLRQDPTLVPPTVDRAGQVPWRRPISQADDPILGREGLLATVGDRLEHARLVTLVGPSGIGKSRSAIEVARRRQALYSLGAVVVDAQGLNDGDALLRRLAGQLDALPPASDVSEVTRLLAGGDVLVVVDDVLPGSPFVGDLTELIATSAATWLVTAPRPLCLAGEHVITVPPLAVDDGIELLLARARAAGAPVALTKESTQAAGRCVELLDRLPLAVELAAPGVVLGLEELVHRLEREREQGRYGVAVSFATSLDQLDDTERRVLALLAVAGTPLDLEFLTAVDDPLLVAAPEATGALVRDGLVRTRPGPHGQALFELAGNVAVEVLNRLPDEQRVDTARVFVGACVRTFAIEQYLCSQHRSADQARRWMSLAAAGQRALDLAHENGLVEEYAAIAAAVHELLVEETGVNLEPLRASWALADPGLSWQRRADLHTAMGVGCLYINDPDGNIRHLDAALALAREHSDDGRLAVIQVNRMTSYIADGTWSEGADEIVTEMFAAAHRSGRPGVLSSAYAVPPLGTHRDCVALLRQGVRHCRREGFPGSEVLTLANLAETLLVQGELEGAERAALEAGALATDLHQPYHAAAMASVLETVRALRGSATSLAQIASLLESSWDVRDLRTATDTVQKLAAGARALGDPALAASCIGVYEAMLADAGSLPAFTEIAFAEAWLEGCSAKIPEVPLNEAVAHLVTTFGGRA